MVSENRRPTYGEFRARNNDERQDLFEGNGSKDVRTGSMVDLADPQPTREFRAFMQYERKNVSAGVLPDFAIGEGRPATDAGIKRTPHGDQRVKMPDPFIRLQFAGQILAGQTADQLATREVRRGLEAMRNL
jgi:hypothetical protein